MAVSVDTVYQKVLAFANKEQRGYITPQEFNLFADQAQMEIFEQYFYDKELFKRDQLGDRDELLEQKRQIFSVGYGVITHGTTIPLDTHRIDYVYLHDSATEHRTLVERVDPSEVVGIKSSSLLSNLSSVPVYYMYNNNMYFHPTYAPNNSLFSLPSGGYTYQIVLTREPVKPQWGYLVINNKALYDSSSSKTTHFELHPSEESELVYKILKFAGVAMKRDDIMRAGQGMEMAKVQQEKQ